MIVKIDRNIGPMAGKVEWGSQSYGTYVKCVAVGVPGEERRWQMIRRTSDGTMEEMKK